MIDSKRVEEFPKAMQWLLDHEHEAGCHSSYLRQMIDDQGAYMAARSLMKREPRENTLRYLGERNRLDLSVEWQVVEYASAFEIWEVEIAQERLRNWRLY